VGDVPVYAVCEHCAFMRTFGSSGEVVKVPRRCPVCGHDVQLHGPRERFPSAYVSRISLKLHRTPPLKV
jgi:hypothetical protein